MRCLLFFVASCFAMPLLANSSEQCELNSLSAETGWIRKAVLAGGGSAPNVDQYFSRVLAVQLNGQPLSHSVVVLQRPCGALLVPESDWNQWRLISVDDPAVLIGDEWYLPLTDLPGVRFRIDQPSETLILVAIPERFAPLEIDWRPFRHITPDSAEPGAFFNLSLSGSRAANSNRQTWSAFGSLGVFGEPGVVVNDLLLIGQSSNSEFLRLRSVFTHDVPDRMWRIEVGDVLSGGGVVGLGSFVGGIRWSRNFQTQPFFNYRPYRNISLLMQDPSVVRIAPEFWNEELHDAFSGQLARVPTGPVELINLPYNGNDDIHVLVSDADGLRQVLTQRSFLRSGLLRKGVWDFEILAGQYRQGGVTDRYDVGVGDAYVRYGLHQDLTVAGQLVLSEGFRIVGAGLETSVPYLGMVELSGARSVNPAEETGSLWRLDVYNRFPNWSWGWSQEWLTEGFSYRPDSTPSQATTRQNISLQWSFARSRGRQNVVTSYTRVLRDGADDSKSARVYLPIRLAANWFMNIGVTQYLEPRKDWLASVTFSMPLDLGRSAKAGRRIQSRVNLNLAMREGDQVRGNFSGTTGAYSGAESWRLNASAGLENPLDSTGIGFHWTADRWAAQAGIGDVFGHPVYRAGVASAVAWVGGQLVQSRVLNNSFAVVDLGSAGAGVRVNGVRADRNGRAVLFNLPPYYPTDLRFNFRDFPMRMAPLQDDISVIPSYRSAVAVHVPIKLRRDFLFTAVDQNGKPLAAGEPVVGAEYQTFVGFDGLVYVADATPGIYRFTVGRGAQLCQLSVVLPDLNEPDVIPDLGSVKCQ